MQEQLVRNSLRDTSWLEQCAPLPCNTVTSLNVTSPIPAVEPCNIPARIPRFSESLPLKFWGWGKCGTTGLVAGSDVPEFLEGFLECERSSNLEQEKSPQGSG